MTVSSTASRAKVAGLVVAVAVVHLHRMCTAFSRSMHSSKSYRAAQGQHSAAVLHLD